MLPESSSSASMGPESALLSATTQVGTKRMAGGEESSVAERRMRSTD